ncbi:MAG: dihydropteroate synthase [Hyphomicrobiaceae bacterium]
MTASVYLRPIGPFCAASPTRGATAAATATPQPPDDLAHRLGLVLGGRTDLLFAAVEVIERDGGWTGRHAASAAEIIGGTGRAALLPAGVKALVDHMRAPRLPVAGLTLDRPRIMGIVNVTPDSFSDGGQFASAATAIAHAERLDAEGADILDIGGESTRPGAEPVTVEEELRRVLPVLEGLAGRTRARLSIDTRKAEVMRRAAVAGAHLINDVSALTHDARSLRVVIETGLPVVLMHARADPRTMQDNPTYDDVLLDVYDVLARRIEACERAGLARGRLIVDPGIGFGKTAAHNLALLSGLSIFHGLGTAVLAGASRKSFIGQLSGAVDPQDRLPGSLAAALAAAGQGAQILRVHDVAATRQALTVWEAAQGYAAARR